MSWWAKNVWGGWASRFADGRWTIIYFTEEYRHQFVWAEDGDAECLMSGGSFFFQVWSHPRWKGTLTLKHMNHITTSCQWRFFDPVKPWVWTSNPVKMPQTLLLDSSDWWCVAIVCWQSCFIRFDWYLYDPSCAFSEQRAAGSVSFPPKKHYIEIECSHVDFQRSNMRNSGTTLTLPKTNIAPENRPSQKETSIPTIHFQDFSGAMLVSGRVILNHDPGATSICLIGRDEPSSGLFNASARFVSL